MILHDLYCAGCLTTRRGEMVNLEALPICCGEPMRVDWSHGRPPATDVRGTPAFFSGLDGSFSTNRAAEKSAKRRAREWTSEMQARGKNVSWTVEGCAGDKQGGAREVRHKRDAAFSYRGQSSRVSTGER
jgi:hypothetical protein